MTTLQPQDKFVIRLPDGMRDQIKASAQKNMRSMNAQIVYLLTKALEGGDDDKS